MTSLKYDDIFSSFLGDVTDYNLVNLNITDATELMQEYLHKALSETYVRRLFSSVDLEDDVQTMLFEMKRVGEEAADKEFVTHMLGKWMTYEWVHNQVRSVLNTAQFFGGAEQKYYAQSNHLSELKDLQEQIYSEARNFIRDAGYISNPYLDGGIVS